MQTATYPKACHRCGGTVAEDCDREATCLQCAHIYRVKLDGNGRAVLSVYRPNSSQKEY